MWSYVKPSVVYLECLKLGHKPILFNFGFNEGLVYCETCHKIYRFKLNNLCFLNENEWVGRVLPKK